MLSASALLLVGLLSTAPSMVVAFHSPSLAFSLRRHHPNTHLPATQEDSSDNSDNVKTTSKEPYYGPVVTTPDILDFDLTGGRPGAIVETEEELARKQEIFEEIERGERKLEAYFDDYGTLQEEEEAEYDTDDPEAMDATKLGEYTIRDLNSKFDYEWDPNVDEDPNLIQDTTGFIQETEKDEEGIEIGYDPIFGPSNPMDTRTKIGTPDSYVIDERSRDDSRVPQEFYPGDPEIELNEEVVAFRKSMDIIESYTDDFLGEELPVPRHTAKWYGYPEQMSYPKQNYTNNRFTDPKDLTNFDALDPYRARVKAVELARAKNAEWLPDGISQEWHKNQRAIYDQVGTLVGTTREGEKDPKLVEMIQPALDILGSCAILLSIEDDTVYRFHYHGLIKNKYGMQCWTETLLRDCGAEVTGVVFETGFRRRDPAYDGGDPYYGPHW